MPNPLILSIDQGTTNTKAILVDAAGQVVSLASRSPHIDYPQPAWVEQDPSELWNTAQAAMAECIQRSEVLSRTGQARIAGVAITNQRETVIAWERATGRPLAPAIVWQCHRSADFCQALTARGLEPLLRQRTGLTVDPMFSGSKMRWLLDNIPYGQSRAENGEICLGTVDAWMLWNLSGRQAFACDYTNASRTQLFNLQALDWDDEILGIFGIPRAALPEPKPSCGVIAHCAGPDLPAGLAAGIPVAALIGDSHAALYGHAGFEPGAIKATYGTGTSLMTPTAHPVLSEHGLSATVAWGKPEGTTYALEGNIYVTGAVVQWLGQVLGGLDAAQIEALARQVGDTEGVYLVPAFVGLGAPHWNPTARGLITGLTRGSGPAHLARAALESIAYQVRDVFEVMAQESGARLEVLLADGGASRNDLLMQFQADMAGCPVIRNLSADVSALGAAYLAGLALGIWSGEAEIKALPRAQERFEPGASAAERQRLYQGWQEAIHKAMA